MKKSCFSILSDNQKYLLCIPTFFDRSKDFKIKVRKEYKHYYVLENGDKISKVKGKWLSNVDDSLKYSTHCGYRNEDGSDYHDKLIKQFEEEDYDFSENN